ncbi:restriction endonuclease subunit S [Vibrio artabrorum]|uniref:restriction endonuclease subunit S n=1 Tax=Vibrio artabrorum TaxID=446374 RepID=UPI003551CBAC
MSFDVKIVALADICSDVSYGYTASASAEPVGPKFLRITDIQGGTVDWDNVPYCEISESKLSKNLLLKGDIVVARTGNSTGENYMYSGDDPSVFASYLIRFKVDHSLANPHFVWLQMRTRRWWDFVSGAKSGSAQAGANAKVLGKFEVSLPPRKIQDHIVNIVSTLSEKIHINTQTNQTLEQMAHAIFKSWFVDFDPVKAKMNGEQPEGMDATTASLFPEKLVESELGLIPDGWELTNIGKVSECFDKKRIPLSKRQREQKQGSIPYYGATSVMDYVDEAIFDDIYLLIGEDGSVMKDDGTPFIQYIWGSAWVNNHAHVLQGIKSVSTEQLMLFFQQTNINAYVTGAVQLKINQRNMNSIPFIKAPKEINERFYDVVAPLYAKIRAIKEENEQLAKLRDTLLPKLLSGEIDLDKVLDV